MRNSIILLSVLIVFVSCDILSNKGRSYSREPHRTFDFHIGNVLYHVYGSSLPIFGGTEPRLVGASLSRIRNEYGLPLVQNMRAECEREDTLVVGAVLTNSEMYSDVYKVGSCYFLLPFSRVTLGAPIALPPDDVYFFNSEDGQTFRASISSFVVTFSEVSLHDYPEKSIIMGTFEMSGADCEGVSFTTNDGFFDVATCDTFEPFGYCIDYYKARYEKN